MKVAEWLDYWLENIVLAEHPYTTFAGYEQCVRLHLKPRLGTKRLNGLSIADVRSFKNAMLRSKGASTTKRALVPLRSALTAAMKEDLLTRNVAQLVDFPEVEVGDYEPWSHSEAITFFRAARAHWLYAGFLFALIMGLRRGEVRGLRWSDVDLEKRTLRVHAQSQRIKVPGRPIVDVDYKPKGKGRKKHKGLIGLPEVLILPLQEQRERQKWQRLRAGATWVENDYVFTGDKGQPMNKDALAGAFRRLCIKLGLRVIRLHDLRHGASSLLADTGAKPHEAQAIMGHSHVDTTMSVYTHAALQAQRDALDRVGALLGAHGTDVNN
ncbi:tyrosine-type recombinase/integrase [Streptomyces sp. NPDC059894]|uniref:tyrosine-type recombinase/integrase n=1 Tax=unclassified Streptomyces TaxID=2593676 RepID=UPI0036594911